MSSFRGEGRGGGWEEKVSELSINLDDEVVGGGGEVTRGGVGLRID